MNYYSDQQFSHDVKKIIGKISDLKEEGTLRDFVTYWLIRKFDPFNADNLIKQMTESNNWLSIIESNSKFRVMYGEKTANEIIKIIEEDQCIVSNKVDLKRNKKRVK